MLKNWIGNQPFTFQIVLYYKVIQLSTIIQNILETNIVQTRSLSIGKQSGNLCFSFHPTIKEGMV